MEYENKAICSKCRGKCCKKSGCDYFVSDFKVINKQTMIDVLSTGNVSIRSYLYERKAGGKRITMPVLSLRARNIDRDVVDLLSFKTQCSMLVDNHCAYSLEERPSGGVHLIPQPNGDCYQDVNYEEELGKWMDYQKLLGQMVKRFSGKSVDEKLQEDIERVLIQVYHQNFAGVKEVEMEEMMYALHRIIICNPKILTDVASKIYKKVLR